MPSASDVEARRNKSGIVAEEETIEAEFNTGVDITQDESIEQNEENKNKEEEKEKQLKT